MDRPSATGSPAASELLVADRLSAPWSRGWVAALGFTFLAGIAVRVLLLPTTGLRDDTDQFAGWIHHIAVNGLGTLYGETAAGPVTFGPVMGYIWAVLAGLEPGFRTATDASDVGIRILVKVPAVIADLGLAAVVAVALRRDPRWAAIGAAMILLHPAVIDVGAWWGQYESVYVLFAVIAAVLAVNRRSGMAVVALTLAVMTKPQALPLLVPFAAWIWSREGYKGLGRATAIGLAVTVLLWLPFTGNGGPLGYLANLAHYQGQIFAFASLRAWNLWWIFQVVIAGGGFIPDATALLGPLTLRHFGLAMAAVLEVLVAWAIVRDPRPRTLVLGLATATLCAFSTLTTMHERYAFAALAFLALMASEPALRWLGVAFGIVFTLNLLAAIPPTPLFAALLPVDGALGIVGSVTMLAVTSAAVLLLLSPRRRDAPA